MTDYGFELEREPNDDRLTAADLRYWRSESPTPLAPPQDVQSPHSFSCCALCAEVPRWLRCSGCPRGGVRFHV